MRGGATGNQREDHAITGGGAHNRPVFTQDALALREVGKPARTAVRVAAEAIGEGAVGGEGDGHKGEEEDEGGFHDV